VFVDVTPLRESRDYRYLYFGQMVSFLGRQLTVVAVPYQVFKITGSSFDVGMVGLVSLGPLVVLSLAGGAIADSVDRRKLLIVTQVALAATSVGLALNAERDSPALWPLFVLTALAAGLSGIDLPTRTAALPNLIRREQLPAAAALGQILIQTGQVAGPAVAGLVIARLSLADAYWFDVATFGAALFALLQMRPLPPEGGGTRAGFGSVREGLRYLRGRRVLQSIFWIDVDAMVLGMPRAVFPALGTNVFHGGASAVGLLYAAPGAGALVGAVTTGWVGSVRRQGRAVIVAVVAWGIAIVAFGFTRWLPAALLFLALAGAADVVSAVFRGTILQTTVPDALRGRLSAINIAVVTGGPRLGDAEAGVVAAAAGLRFSVVSGGLGCVLGVALLSRLFPELDRHTAPVGGAPPTTTLDPSVEAEGE